MGLNPFERRLQLASTLGVIWALLISTASVAGIFDTFEDVVLDWGQTLHNATPYPDRDLALIAIEQVSTDRPWPWPRFEYALMTRALIDRAPHSIVFEVLFNDDDARSSAFDDTFLSYVHRIPKRVFAGAVLRSPDPDPLPEGLTSINVKGERAALPTFGSLLWPLTHLIRDSQAGPRNILPSVNQPLRRIPLIFNVDGTITPSLALQAAAIKIGADPNLTRVVLAQHIELVHSNGKVLRTIPIDKEGCMRLRFYPKQERFLTINFDDFLVMADQAERGTQPSIDLNLLRKRQIWISCTDRSVSRPILTVVGLRPPVEIHMQAVKMILDNNFTRFWHPVLIFLCFIAFSIFFSRIFVEWGMSPGMALLLVVGLVWGELHMLLYQWLNLAFPLVAFGVLLVGLVAMGLAARLWQFEDEPSPKLLLEFSTVPTRAIAQLPAPAQARVEREFQRHDTLRVSR
ncbi:MAG: CHASE2 domain-containing protein [Methylacidiphilales bacterium]|nr:CHASE2 domain-containing protein [Candidatus Methylacidiphilales bacterium]MDW8349040.1 CHASE2 domain-containing protein [Verrucomicrobiae bacterium]